MSEGLLASERGTVTIEYTIVLSLVGLGVSLALLALGAPLLRLFHYQQTLLLLPVP